ncbi:hypothetical protein FPV67DRAFT_1450855 [Lyophyllum atratum]|nr:hypothetical protein FPV67DRAFT_1450855 [Lyophyllum atratum]
MFLLSLGHFSLTVQQVTAPQVPRSNFQTQIFLSAIQFIIGGVIFIWLSELVLNITAFDGMWVILGRNHWIALGPLAILGLAAGTCTTDPPSQVVVTAHLCVDEGMYLKLLATSVEGADQLL